MPDKKYFLKYKRKEGPYRPVKERLADFKEVKIQLPAEEISTQALRCIGCGVPFCHSLGCPAGNLIPELNELVYRGKWDQALERLIAENPLPEITGRICPALCEASCTLSINDSPVNIKEIELAIIERGFKEGWIKPPKPENENGKTIAVIGSGPAGLAAAQILRENGCEVTVFEKDDKPGGILRYGIPDFKLEKSVLNRRIELLKEGGVNFQTRTEIGKDISPDFLRRNFDALLLTAGAGAPRDLEVPGRELDGIHFAMEYLTGANRAVSGELEKGKDITAEGKNVLVIGGGDTGSDCVGTANRQGAKKVYQFEIMDRPEKWEKSFNPVWPHFPPVLKTTSSHQEGVERRWNISTLGFNGEGGKVDSADFIEVETLRDGKTGKVSFSEIEGTEFSLDVDLVLIAMGFVHVNHSKFLNELNVQYDRRGNIMVDENYSVNGKDIYAAGDAVSGATLAVNAINSGKQAALSIIKNIRP